VLWPDLWYPRASTAFNFPSTRTLGLGNACGSPSSLAEKVVATEDSTWVERCFCSILTRHWSHSCEEIYADRLERHNHRTQRQ
ncbi:hypothetical protein RSAG8_11628, partial [Rhizoctonia solani AG-8 WAC10335]